ncbi:hypothetical protein EDB19DRAFT_2029520 [Suillus lakei]|nr:hypothetical protein EDB19DRAFT_2029520 [Suillus lakei]
MHSYKRSGANKLANCYLLNDSACRQTIRLTISRQRRVCSSLQCVSFLSIRGRVILSNPCAHQCVYISITTFWTYDYICSLHEEWRFLLVSHRTKVKGLYIVTRYVPFLLLATNLYLSFIPNETPSKCRVLDNICSGFGILSAVCSEGFFVLRTCALWNNNRILVVAMLFTVITFVAASIGISFATTAPAPYAISTIPGITGCYQRSSSLELFIPFLLLSAFELGLLTLTLTRAIQNWRINTSRLYVVLVKHNIFYYTCGLCESTLTRQTVFPCSSMIIPFSEVLSVANIFTSLLLHFPVHDPRDPRHAHAPPSLADEAADTWLWCPHANSYVRHVACRVYDMTFYPVAYSGSSAQ